MVILWASAGLTSLQPSGSCACSADGPSSRERSVKVRRRMSCQQLLLSFDSAGSLAAHWSGMHMTASCAELVWPRCHWSGQGRAASCTELPPQTRGNLLSRSALNSSKSTITSTLVCASTQSSVCSAVRLGVHAATVALGSLGTNGQLRSQVAWASPSKHSADLMQCIALSPCTWSTSISLLLTEADTKRACHCGQPVHNGSCTKHH